MSPAAKPEPSMVLNALAAIVASAILAGITWLITQSIDSGKHLVKIDTLLEMQSMQVPKLVEDKLAELRNRINLNEERINELDRSRNKAVK